MADNAPVIDEDGYVELKLAHPLSAEQVNNLRPKEPVDRDHSVGDSVFVTRDYGLSIIDSGYAMNVDPEDRVAVRRALGLNTKMQPLTPEELASLSGDGQTAATAPLEGLQSAADVPSGEQPKAPEAPEAPKPPAAAPAAASGPAPTPQAAPTSASPAAGAKPVGPAATPQ